MLELLQWLLGCCLSLFCLHWLQLPLLSLLWPCRACCWLWAQQMWLCLERA